jgi:hypothetical protein
MPVNPDYYREYTYDINAYLIVNYPKMNMATRRSICSLASQWIDSDFIEEAIDECVSYYAKDKLNISKKEEEEDDS